MAPIDLIIIAAYIGGLLFMGYKLSKGNESQEDYFIGGRSMPWFPVALSIAATTISANGFVGGTGWAYNSGMMAFMLQISIPLVILLAGCYFIPFLYNLNVTSCYEYIEMRLGSKSRTLSALGFIATSTIQVSSMIYIPSMIVCQLTGWHINAVVPIIVLVSVLYTLMGGIKAVIWSDAIQMIIMWGGLAAVIIIALSNMDIGFFEALSVAKEAGKLKALDFSFDISMENGAWVALIGGTIMWLQYYATDQSQVQRMFASKSVAAAKQSMLVSAFVMNGIYFVFMIVGLIMFSYYGGKAFPSSNAVLIDFILTKIPSGILGLMIAAVFAAAMSSVDSLLNSISTVFTKDIYERHISKGRTASLKTSMLFTAVVAIIICLFTLMAFVGTTSSVLAVVGGYISFLCGSILAVFILAMFTEKANDTGTAIGFVAGVIVTAIVANNTPINWLWYNLVGGVVSIIVGYVCSILIKDKTPENTAAFTYKGQRAALLQQPEGASNPCLPGRKDGFFWTLLIFFALQYVIFFIMQS